MNIQYQTQAISSRLLTLSDRYQTFKQTIHPNHFADLHQLATSFQNDIANAQQEGRFLRIGIIGQIKRGKSSFLNSLLFNGQDILPKAATPMTAALTRISYSEQPEASVEFYTVAEWQTVEQTAAKVKENDRIYQQTLAAFRSGQSASRGKSTRPPQAPRPSEEEKACCELVAMVAQSGITVTDYLGTIHRIDGADSNQNLIEKLTDFVGAQGRFTPIVKSTELKLNVPGLDGIEVVDTPGMNDPIVSRGRRTQEFIGQCDVVFFLSYCSQFMDMHDMALLAQNIPHKGIREILLIGSVFDSALLDEYHNYPSIAQALPGITHKLNNLAQQNVERVCQQGQANRENSVDDEGYIFAALQKALPPTFISSRCYDLAIKGTDLSEEEAHSLKQLNAMYPGFEFSSQLLMQLANFKKVHERMDEVRSNKTAILDSRLADIVKGTRLGVRHCLQQMESDINHRRKQLAEGDLETLAKQQATIIQRIKTGEVRIQQIFSQQQQALQQQMQQLLLDLRAMALDAKRVETESGTKQEAYEVARTVSASKWYNPFSWGSTRTVYETQYRTINYTYANVQQAVDKLETFVLETEKQLISALGRAVDINRLRQEIKQLIREMFDFSADSFDPNAVMLPLENALARLTVPAITMDMDQYINEVRQQFTTATVENDSIARLRQEQGRVVGILVEQMSGEIDRNTSSMLTTMTTEGESFIPELTRELNNDVEQLGKDLKNRQQVMAEYDQLLELLAEDLNNLNH